MLLDIKVINNEICIESMFNGDKILKEFLYGAYEIIEGYEAYEIIEMLKEKGEEKEIIRLLEKTFNIDLYNECNYMDIIYELSMLEVAKVWNMYDFLLKERNKENEAIINFLLDMIFKREVLEILIEEKYPSRKYNGTTEELKEELEQRIIEYFVEANDICKKICRKIDNYEDINDNDYNNNIIAREVIENDIYSLKEEVSFLRKYKRSIRS